MKKQTALFIFIFLAQTIIGQNAPGADEFFSIKITPTSILNVNRRTVLIGMEIKPKPEMGISFEYGFFYPLSGNSVTDISSFKNNFFVHRSKLEFRRYTKLRPKYSHYTAYAISHYNEQHSDRTGLAEFANGNRFRYSFAKIKQTAWIAHINFGNKFWSGNRIYFEPYAGPGIKFVHYDYIFLENPTPAPSKERVSSIAIDSPASEIANRWYVIPFFDFGLKIGCSF